MSAESTQNLKPMDFPLRAKRLLEVLEAENLDALLVTDLENIRWLTGFSGSAALLIFSQSQTVLVTDGRYDGQAQQEIQASGAKVEVKIENAKQKEVILSGLKKSKRIGLEADDISWEKFRTFESEWFDANIELVPTTELITTLRRQKDEGEVDRIRMAAHIADQALEKVKVLFAEQPSEKQIARELESAMLDFGAEGISFETIVAAGKHSAWAHARPGNNNHIQNNQLLLIDMGALVDGYHSDMSRTFAIGDPGGEQAEMYEVVEKAQAAGVEHLKAGVGCAEVDKVCRDMIAEAGYGDSFTHSTGHGVGLNIHELPRVTAKSTETLAVGDIVTVEPGIYLESYGGVRIEDICLITDDGCEVLSQTPKIFSEFFSTQ